MVLKNSLASDFMMSATLGLPEAALESLFWQPPPRQSNIPRQTTRLNGLAESGFRTGPFISGTLGCNLLLPFCKRSGASITKGKLLRRGRRGSPAREVQAGVAKQHEFHSLKENARRIPVS